MFFSKLFLAGLFALMGTTSVLATPVPGGPSSSSKAVAGSEMAKKGVNEAQVDTRGQDLIERKEGSDDLVGDDRGGDRLRDDSDSDSDSDYTDSDSDSDSDDDRWTRKSKPKRKQAKRV